MALLVRKIARGKWPDNPCSINCLQADAISDLRTQGNTLSVWRVENSDELEEAILALAASSKTEKIETITIVWADEEVFLKNGITVTDTVEGDTVVTDLRPKHRDLSNLSYESLGVISGIIMNGLNSSNTKRVPRLDVKKILVNAYKNNRISKEICTENLNIELINAVNKVSL